MESAGRGLLSSNEELSISFDILLHLVNYCQGGIKNGFMGSAVVFYYACNSEDDIYSTANTVVELLPTIFQWCTLGA